MRDDRARLRDMLDCIESIENTLRTVVIALLMTN